MDGVTILQVITKTFLNETSEHLIAGSVIIGIMAIFLTMIFWSEIGLNSGWTIASILLLFSCITLIIIEVTCGEHITETTYRVLVDSNVNMNEFFSKYELIRTEGLIYVVKEIANGI